MIQVIYDRASGLVLRASRMIREYDAATEAEALTTRFPDPRLERADGLGGFRQATPQEVAEFDDARRSAEAGVHVDDKVIKAVLIYVVQKLNEVRTNPTQVLAALTATEVRQGVIEIHKTL